MELETGGKRIANVSADDVVRELRAEDEFVILSASKEEFVQTGGGVLEYHENGRHFRAARTPIDASLIERVFLSYLAGDGRWRRLVEWEDVTDELRRSGHWQMWIALAAIAALIAWLAYRLMSG